MAVILYSCLLDKQNDSNVIFPPMSLHNLITLGDMLPWTTGSAWCVCKWDPIVPCLATDFWWNDVIFTKISSYRVPFKMTDILCTWLNDELHISQKVGKAKQSCHQVLSKSWRICLFCFLDLYSSASSPLPFIVVLLFFFFLKVVAFTRYVLSRWQQRDQIKTWKQQCCF